MKIIAVLNQKGGAGKTTIATHLAMALRIAGHTVTLVDSDPQGSARDWAAARESNEVIWALPVIGIDRPTISKDLAAVAPVDWVIIDGAPQAADLAVSAIKAADYVLIPVQPSPYDVWATSDLVDLVKARMEVTDGALGAGFVVSRAISGTVIGRDIEGILEGYGLPVLASRVHQRVMYAATAGTGSTVLEDAPNDWGAREINALMEELKGIIK